jgi:hypothetical protein
VHLSSIYIKSGVPFSSGKINELMLIPDALKFFVRRLLSGVNILAGLSFFNVIGLD